MSDIEAVAGTGRGWGALSTAAWLGWQLESNWARPALFALYSVVKPLSFAGILIAMYVAITGVGFDSAAFAFLYVGNAFYIYVGAVMSGMGWTIVQDREHYKTLRSVYTSPVDVRVYLIGRVAARFGVATISVLITLLLGVMVLGIPIRLATVNWPLLVGALALGVILLAFMGLAMAGIMLLSGQEAWGVGELLAGALYLFSAAVFPLDVLPRALQAIGLAIPVTYWLELMRRALGVAGVPSFRAVAAWSDLYLVAVLAASTAVAAVISLAAFHLCERRARELGLLDRTSNY